MISLVYVSSAVREFSPEQLSSLLDVSQHNNAAQDITGILLYIGGNFMQALEGEDAAVDALARKISRDPRHRQVKQLLREPIAQRQFAQWSMGLLRLSDLPAEDRARCTSLIETTLQGQQGQGKSLTRTLLESFRRNMR